MSLRNITGALILTIILTYAAAARHSFNHREKLPQFSTVHTWHPSPRGVGLELLVYVRITNDQLLFLRSDTGFYARYQVICELYREDRIQAHALAERTLTAAEFPATNDSRLGDEVVLQLPAAPGEQELWIRLRDRHTGREKDYRKTVQLPAYHPDSCLVSRPLLVELTTDSLGSTHSRPLIDPLLNEDTGELGIHFETWCPEIRKARLELYVRQNGNVVYHRDSLLSNLSPGHYQETLHLPREPLRSGNYQLELSLDFPPPAHRVSFTLPFRVHWHRTPANARDLDAAIDQLVYILPAKELTRLQQELKGRKEALFEKFWKELDPTPQTEENELREEYYRRVEWANNHFSLGGLPGWRTDRGRIYILLGPPDSVESHPFSTETHPHEIWYYYEKNLRFVFVDTHGFGDYRLVNPGSLPGL